MSTSVKLPQWGMSMSEGTVIEWLVAEGDLVEADQDLVDIEAAKTTSTILSPVAGRVGPLLVEEGDTVPINTVLCEIHGEDESVQAEVPPQTAALAGETVGLDTGTDATAGRGAASQEEHETHPVPRDPAAARAESGRTVNVVPRARQLAAEKGVDLAAVTGSGPGGRILVADVEKSGGTGTPTRPETPPQHAAAGDVRSISSMRRTIGERMSASLRDAAQLTLTSTADVTELSHLRESVGAGARKPGYVAAVIRACALALRRHPGIRAQLDGDRMLIPEGVHIGMAVALDDGLVVPVLRDADRVPLAELDAEVRRLAEAARAGELSPEDYSGGTFSVTSLGGQGVDAFTPILNPPESAILGVGRSREVPARFGDGLMWRQEMTLSLTIDHRVIDGYPGALFLQEVVRLLEHPTELV